MPTEKRKYEESLWGPLFVLRFGLLFFSYMRMGACAAVALSRCVRVFSPLICFLFSHLSLGSSGALGSGSSARSSRASQPGVWPPGSSARRAEREQSSGVVPRLVRPGAELLTGGCQGMFGGGGGSGAYFEKNGEGSEGER